MSIKLFAQKAGLRTPAQLSASKVPASLDANLDSASPRWAVSIAEII